MVPRCFSSTTAMSVWTGTKRKVCIPYQTYTFIICIQCISSTRFYTKCAWFWSRGWNNWTLFTLHDIPVSTQNGIIAFGKAHTWFDHISRQCPQGCPQNSANVGLVEHRSFPTSDRGRWTRHPLPFSSFFPVRNAVIFWSVCTQNVPQASQYFCATKLQTGWDVCLACQSILTLLTTYCMHNQLNKFLMWLKLLHLNLMFVWFVCFASWQEAAYAFVYMCMFLFEHVWARTLPDKWIKCVCSHHFKQMSLKLSDTPEERHPLIQKPTARHQTKETNRHWG